MALSQLMTNAGGANGLTALAKQVVTIHVNAALGTPRAHLGNTRSTATTQPKSLPTRIERMSTRRDTSERKATWSSAATSGVKGTATTASTGLSQGM